MEKPYSFTEQAIKKYGKRVVNDFPEPDRFFNSMRDFYILLDAIPYKAIEDLEKYELNRDIVVQSIQKLIRICKAAKVDINKEIDRLEESPFDGLEDDIALKKNKIIQQPPTE
jgi:hypothetical protein